MILSKTRFQAGTWEGVLDAGDVEPVVEVRHQGTPLGTVELGRLPGEGGLWRLRFRVPAEFLSDGISTFVIMETSTNEKLGVLSILAGEVLDDDLRAEIALLRAELDMMKRAFRRHFHERSGD